MIRALYTAASGMSAQQQNIDNVAHNLANVNTTGMKASRAEFSDLYASNLGSGGSANTPGIGVQTARAAYSLITKQNLPLPHIVLRPGRLVTKANVGSIPSWAAQLKAIK